MENSNAFIFKVRSQDEEEFLKCEKDLIDKITLENATLLNVISDKTFINVYHECVKHSMVEKLNLVQNILEDLSDFVCSIRTVNSTGDLSQYLFGKSASYQMADEHNDRSN